jgi:hypothetical protein
LGIGYWVVTIQRVPSLQSPAANPQSPPNWEIEASFSTIGAVDVQPVAFADVGYRRAALMHTKKNLRNLRLLRNLRANS